MNRSLKVTLVVVVLGLAGYYWNDSPEPLPPTALPANAGPDTDAVASAADFNKAENETTERIAAKAAVTDDLQAPHPFELELALHMLDEHGLPVSGHKPRFAPPGGELRTATEATDGRGRNRRSTRPPPARAAAPRPANPRRDAQGWPAHDRAELVGRRHRHLPDHQQRHVGVAARH